jgi:hypothetical protein
VLTVDWGRHSGGWWRRRTPWLIRTGWPGSFCSTLRAEIDYEVDELSGFQGPCLSANRELDANASLERINSCPLPKWIHDRRDREPDVPLLFLASAETRYDGPGGELMREWVESWSPGEWRIVSSPHWMDDADPELVADAVREVIDLTH